MEKSHTPFPHSPLTPSHPATRPSPPKHIPPQRQQHSTQRFPSPLLKELPVSLPRWRILSNPDIEIVSRRAMRMEEEDLAGFRYCVRSGGGAGLVGVVFGLCICMCMASVFAFKDAGTSICGR